MRFFDILSVGLHRRGLCCCLQNCSCRNLRCLRRDLDSLCSCFCSFLGCLLTVGYGISKPAASDSCQSGSDLSFFFLTHARSLSQSILDLGLDSRRALLACLLGFQGFAFFSGFFLHAQSLLRLQESCLFTCCLVGFFLRADSCRFTGSIKLSLCLPAGFFFCDSCSFSLSFSLGFCFFLGTLFSFSLQAGFLCCFLFCQLQGLLFLSSTAGSDGFQSGCFCFCLALGFFFGAAANLFFFRQADLLRCCCTGFFLAVQFLQRGLLSGFLCSSGFFFSLQASFFFGLLLRSQFLLRFDSGQHV